MSKNERWIIAAILFSIAILTSVDIYNDYFQGVALWHILIESTIAFIALMGVYFVLKGHFRLQRSLEKEQKFSNEFQAEAKKWRRVSKTYLEGLSVEIENQLDHWELTDAEKDVTFLLLKGLSIKEIANIRNTSTKTVRTQTNAIYSKSGLAGRSELSAFFLEDLLLPKKNL